MIIDIIAPGYGTKYGLLNRCAEYLKSRGITASIHECLLGDDLFSSNKDEQRLAVLIDALTNKNSDAIWCLKGGYGTTRIIDELVKRNPKIIDKPVIGYSDISALHVALNQNFGIHSIHGPVLYEIATERIDDASIDRIFSILDGSAKPLSLELESINNNIYDKISAPLKGGNLIILQHSIGTNWQFDATDSIVIFEDIDERPYRLDRTLHHISSTCNLSSAKAIIFADFTVADLDIDMSKIEAMFQRFAANIDVPVFRTSGIGHGNTNLAFKSGADAAIENNRLIQI